MAVISAENIIKSFGRTEVLGGVSLSAGAGETVCLLGVSGAGKTTLLNILAGLSAPDSGRVLINGSDATGKPGRVSYMLQKDLLLPHKKVIDNVALPLVIKGAPKSKAREKAAELFPLFGLEGTEYRYPSALSGGMRQRAALMRTYLASDGAVLLDEPFSALDAITKSAMHEWYLATAGKLGLTTLFITHDIDEAIVLSDRVCVLSGRPAVISSEITVTPPRGERGRDFALTDGFLRLKRAIVSALGNDTL
jgi:ABC-type nitrate/sulfonate/bicarbonate transport system ATPase subunit